MSIGDVLETLRDELHAVKFEARLDLPAGVLGETKSARLANRLDSRGDTDPVAHEVPVALLNGVADMNTDTELNTPVCRHAGVALDEPGLHFDCAAHRVDHAVRTR